MNLSTDDFDFLRDLLDEQLGMAIDDDQREFVAGRLATLAQRQGMSRIEVLVASLRTGSNRPLLQEVCEALVTHETSFFRDPHYFDELADHIIPQRIVARASERRLKIWCAACSTGQEPYSLAMLLRERFLEPLRSWNLDILASDFSTKALERARTGHFSDVEIGRGLSAARQSQHFRRDPSGWQIDPRLRSMVRFERINLLSNWPTLEDIDVVLLRNVMIYMTTSTRQSILQRLRRVLHPTGCIMLGSTESPGLVDIRCIQPTAR